MVNYDPTYPFGKGSPVAIEEFLTDNGQADYVLCDGGHVPDVVEAKKAIIGRRIALTQVDRYSRGSIGGPNLRGYPREIKQLGHRWCPVPSRGSNATMVYTHILTRGGQGVGGRSIPWGLPRPRG